MAASNTDAKGVVMSASRQSKELAARQRDGLRVVLRWHPCEDAVTVSVADDRTGDRFEIAVEHEYALDAFYHPYAYAA
jgi:RNA 3'-terminal phosphate cyclase